MKSRSEIQRHRSRLWYLLPIFLSIAGGLIGYIWFRSNDPTVAKSSLLLGIITAVVLGTISGTVYLAYLNEVHQVQGRLSASKTIDTSMGKIEYGDFGQGTPILSIHGAGGGFDQGLITAKAFFDEETLQSHRIISPSRFGYLQTPLPSGDAGPAAQADAHEALLEALGIDEKVIVLGTSAGAISAQEFAIKYPERVSALILAVPAVWTPESARDGSAEIGSNNFIANIVMRSDFAMWIFMKVSYSQLLTYVGVPEHLQEKMTAEEKDDAKKLMDAILPVSRKVDGAAQEAINMANKQRLALESIRAPTLVIDAKDVVTYPGSKFAAEHISNAKLVEFETGGHLLVGHGEEARAITSDFVRQNEGRIVDQESLAQ